MPQSPSEYVPQSIRPSTQPLTFSEFKRLINEMDEAAWGESLMYVGDDAKCPVVDIAFISGLPAARPGSSAARWYGVSEATPSKVSIQFKRV